MSANVVVPLRAISMPASSVPQYTSSGSTVFASIGNTTPLSQSISARSSAMPRITIIGTWPCVLTRPGMTRCPVASIVSRAAGSASPAAITASIFPSRIAIDPPASTRICGSTVTTVPPRTSRSTGGV